MLQVKFKLESVFYRIKNDEIIDANIYQGVF